jgi:hypothetical protein
VRWLSYIEPSDCKTGQPMPYWRSAAPPTRSSAKSCASATSMESRSKVPSAEAVQRLTPFSRSWPWAMTTVVVGVRPRSGEALFFGQVAAELLDKAPCSLLMVASEPFVARVDRDLRTEELTSREFTCGGWVR